MEWDRFSISFPTICVLNATTMFGGPMSLKTASALRTANFFDIDWRPVKKEFENKVLIPVLGDQYGNVLENQELQLTFEEGAFFVSYYGHNLPITPETYADILKYRMEDLGSLLSSDDPHLVELQSILTALVPFTGICGKRP